MALYSPVFGILMAAVVIHLAYLPSMVYWMVASVLPYVIHFVIKMAIDFATMVLLPCATSVVPMYLVLIATCVATGITVEDVRAELRELRTQLLRYVLNVARERVHCLLKKRFVWYKIACHLFASCAASLDALLAVPFKERIDAGWTDVADDAVAGDAAAGDAAADDAAAGDAAADDAVAGEQSVDSDWDVVAADYSEDVWTTVERPPIASFIPRLQLLRAHG